MGGRTTRGRDGVVFRPHPATFAAVPLLRRALTGQPGVRGRGGGRGGGMISFGMILLYDKLCGEIP
jgi:hypothetical protein